MLLNDSATHKHHWCYYMLFCYWTQNTLYINVLKTFLQWNGCYICEALKNCDCVNNVHVFCVSVHLIPYAHKYIYTEKNKEKNINIRIGKVDCKTLCVKRIHTHKWNESVMITLENIRKSISCDQPFFADVCHQCFCAEVFLFI